MPTLLRRRHSNSHCITPCELLLVTVEVNTSCEGNAKTYQTRFHAIQDSQLMWNRINSKSTSSEGFWRVIFAIRCIRGSRIFNISKTISAEKMQHSK